MNTQIKLKEEEDSMSIDTSGKIKGFISHEGILEFIRHKWDKNAKDDVKTHRYYPLSECDWRYKINEHSMDNEYFTASFGFIYFKYNDENRMLFYTYSNINTYDNLDYYSKHNLKDMVEAETTTISLGCWGDSVSIITDIVTHFGGGWIDKNDCDDEEYIYVEGIEKHESHGKEMTENEKIIKRLYEDGTFPLTWADKVADALLKTESMEKGENMEMTLRDFLLKKTNPRELCVVRESGWIIASCWIDYEDLFAIPERLADNLVKNDEWGYLCIVDEHNSEIKIPCHYIDV